MKDSVSSIAQGKISKTQLDAFLIPVVVFVFFLFRYTEVISSRYVGLMKLTSTLVALVGITYVLLTTSDIKHVVLAMSICICTSFLNNLIVSEITIFAGLRAATMIGIGYILYHYRDNRHVSMILHGLFWTISAYFLYCMLMRKNPETVLPTMSRNGISWVMIFTTILYYVGCRNDKYPLIPTIVTFIFCLWSQGRTGIITAAILLAGVLLYGNKNRKMNSAALAVIMVSIAISLVLTVVFVGFDLSEIFSYFYLKGMNNNARILIWKGYFEELFSSFKNLFFGVNGKTVPSLVSYSNGSNPHNTFITLHMNFGIIAFVFVMTNFSIAIVRIIQKKNWLYLFFLISLIARSLMDTVGFPGLFDILLWYFIFYAFDSKNEMSTIVQAKKMSGILSEEQIV